MKKLSLLLVGLLIVGTTFACEGDKGSKKECCKKGEKKECCKKGEKKSCDKKAQSDKDADQAKASK
ncbi:MAG: hypothetical protein KDC07_05875 [Chitinophagaceae bacterium]|nr:hypothetical protein [Chitinophagaceae bacterium]MCB9044949.1 hypothetical protein [Chitinophagales bacterium]